MAHSINLIQSGANPQLTISIEEFVKLKQIPINRKSEDRVNKMSYEFESNYATNMARLLSIVHVGIVMNDFIDSITGYQYKEGEQYILDGNTRKNYWLQHTDKWHHHEEGLTAVIYPLHNFEQVRKIYDSFDSTKSAKNISEKIQGEFNRHGFYPQQQLLLRGNFAVALKWCHRSPTEPELPLVQQVHMCLSALREFDNIEKEVVGLDGKKETFTITRPRISRLASAPIYSAIMTALRLFPNSVRLHEFIEKFITQDENDIRTAINSKRVTPYEIIAIEWLGWSDQRSKNKNDAPLWLDNHAGQTATQYQKKQLDFVLHWIQSYLDNPNYNVQFSNGIKSTTWGKYDEKNPSTKDLIGGWELFYKNAVNTRKKLSKADNSANFNQSFTYGTDALTALIQNSEKKTLSVY